MNLQIYFTIIFLRSILCTPIVVYEYKIGETYDSNEISGCLQIKMDVNYKRVKINITKSSFVKNFLVTDTNYNFDCKKFENGIQYNRLETFNIFEARAVPNTPVAIQEEENYEISECISHIYIYIKSFENTQARLTITSSYDEKRGCIASEETSWVVCGQYTLDECINGCNHDCTYLECSSNIDDDTEKQKIPLSSLCAPDSRVPGTYKQMCSNYDAKYHIVGKNCSTGWKPYVPEPKIFNSPIFYIFTMIVLIVCGSSCLYRYQINRNQEPSFHPPKYCPEWLFPQPDKNGGDYY